MKLTAFINMALIMAAMEIPASGQTPGRRTPLTEDDSRILQLVGDSFSDTMGGIGNVYLYLSTKEPEYKATVSTRMNQADKNLQELKKHLLLTRPAGRDLHQAMDTVISAKALLQTGIQSLMATLNKPKTNDLPQKITIFSARADHFGYTFEALERALLQSLVLKYGTDNRDLKAAQAVAGLQWDSVESVALVHKALYSGNRIAAVQFDNKLADFDRQIASFRANRDLAMPDQKNIAVALNALMQNKTRFAAKAHDLFQARATNQGVAPSSLTMLKKDIQAFMGAVRDFADLAFKTNVAGD